MATMGFYPGSGTVDAITRVRSLLRRRQLALGPGLAFLFERVS